MNKISEESKRTELVNKLKDKIRKELNDFFKYSKYYMSEALSEDYFNQDEYENLCKEVTAHSHIKEYINSDYSFMDYSAKYDKQDTVYYYIKDKTILIWLQDGFNFCDRWLNTFGTLENVDDQILEHNLVSPFEEVVYDMGINNNESEESNATST